jgi:2-(1,2-epoxy-1,2-dihydrophenyl)acetyl-CoA isomerase
VGRGIGNALAPQRRRRCRRHFGEVLGADGDTGFHSRQRNTWLLPRLVGLARAKHMILRGKAVDGPTAAMWGLIADCVAPDELDNAVASVVDELRRAATIAVGLAKTLIHRNLDLDLAEALQNEAIYEELAVRTDDFKEGIRAFREKRAPHYEGR